jgi:hypothetical protein
MAHVQIKEPVTAQVVFAFVIQGLKEKAVKVEIVAMLNSLSTLEITPISNNFV